MLRPSPLTRCFARRLVALAVLVLAFAFGTV